MRIKAQIVCSGGDQWNPPEQNRKAYDDEGGEMQKVRAWLDALLDRAEANPVTAPLMQLADENVILGVVGGTLFMFVLGLIGGAANRGVAGALVGGISAALAGAAIGGLAGRLIPARDGEATIAIEMAEHAGGYAGGEPVNGYVLVSAKRNCRVTGGSVYLTCRAVFVHDAAGGGDASQPEMVRDVKTYHMQELPIVPSGLIRRNVPVRYPFRLMLPDDPLPTHHGFGCAVRWTLYAGLDGGPQMLDRSNEEIMVRSSIAAGAGRKSERVGASSAVGELTLALQHTTYSEGETIRGRVILSPSEDFAATELRTMLLRVENHPQGNGTIVYINGWNSETGRYRGESHQGGEGTTYVWLEDEAILASDARYNMGEKKLYDFTFEVPQQWRPTLITDDGTVTWRIVSTLTRANGQDMRVHQGITVHTTTPRIARVMASDQEAVAEGAI